MQIPEYFRGIGRALAGGYDAGESFRGRSDLPWRRRTAQDEDHIIGDFTRSLIRLKAADLHRNNAIVSGVGDRIALFAVGARGIIPQAKTSDSGWNREAEQWWAEWSRRLDSRERCSMLDFQRMAVALRPTFGGMYFQKIADGSIRPVECERIRDPRDAGKAKAYCEGVRMDPNSGKILSYRVHSRDQNGGFGMEHSEEEVIAASMIPVIRPAWRPDQVREIPDLAPVVPALQDIHEMNTYALNTAKWQQKIVGFLKRMGGAANSGMRGATPTVGQRQEIKFDWGILLEGFQGDGIDLVSSNSPGPQHIPYIKLQLALCSAAIGFPYEFLTLDLSGLDYSRQKGMLLLVNNAIRPWQQWLIDRMLTPMWNWRIAMEMRSGGQLSPAPATNGISEWQRVEWQPPEELWIDRQEASQSDLLEWQMRQGALSEFNRRRGKDYEDTLRQQARDYKLERSIEVEEGLPEGTLKPQMQIPGQTQAPATPAAGTEKTAPMMPMEDH